MMSTFKVLVLLPNWLGDAAMATPALRAIRARFPDGEITVAGRSSATALVEGLPFFSRSVTLGAGGGIGGMLGAARNLRRHARDLAVVFPHSFRAALLARLSGSQRRIGYGRGGRSFLLTDAVPPHVEDGKVRPIYMAREYVELLAPLGCRDDGQGLQLAADAAVVEAMKLRLDMGRPRVGFAPGAAFGPSKMWPAERYGEVADTLARETDAQCVLLTGPGEEAVRDNVVRSAKTSFISTEPAGGGIKGLKAAISQLDLLICNDSGARHVAVAFGVPTVCIMGPTSPAYSNGPYERGKVLRVDVDCGPCQKPVCTTDHRCMTRITVEQVVRAAMEVLAI